MTRQSRERSHDTTSRFYDFGLKLHWFGRYRRFRRSQLAAAGPLAGKTILDFGCGTGLLYDFLRQQAERPGLYVGIDPGQKMLAMARTKYQAAVDHLLVRNAVLPQLPVAGRTIDIFVSSLVTHQLPRASKELLLREAYRVLKPGGRLVLAEFGAPVNLPGRLSGWYLRAVWGRILPAIGRGCDDNLAGRLPGLIAAAGFGSVTTVAVWKGMVHVMAAVKPV